MKVYDNKHIKTVAFVGAHHSGKTTLAETMLFEAGLLNRRGSVEEKNTVSDFHDIEKERQNSIFATPLHTEWRNYKINIIDTPGLDDFIGEIASTMRITDTTLMVINAQHGAEVGTEIIWNYVDRFSKPTVFVINQIDHPKADFDASFTSIVDLVGNNAIKIQYPLKIDGAQCIIDVLKMKMYKFGPEGGKPEKFDIPADQKEMADMLHNELVEKAAENDEDLMELFFDKGTLNEDEMRMGIKKGMLNHELFPVFCISAINDMGSGRLMGFIDNVAPSAIDLKEEQSVEGETVKRTEDPTTLFVFKTMNDPNLGKITFFKVKAGELTQGTKLVNSRTGDTETINQLFIMKGKDRDQVDKLSVGDIGATLKLKITETNDTLHTEDHKITIKPIKYPVSRIKKAIHAVDGKDEEKLHEALRKIHSQDPTCIVEYSKELKQHILGCQGELHLQVIDLLLKNVYNVNAVYEQPRIAYRETIQRSATTSYRHKKQSGGSGQFGEVHIKIEPYREGMADPEGFNVRGIEEVELDWGGKLVFVNCIVGGSIDTRYLPAVMKGVLEVMEEGPLTGSYARDIRVMLFDGKMHSVDSNDLSFRLAGAHAFKEAFLNASPKLMEPIHDLVVKMPEEMMGNVMTDLQARRAIVMGMEGEGKYQKITAKVPLAEMYKYSTSLRSLTQGRGSFVSTFDTFQPVPTNIQSDLIKKRAADTAED
ncbi:MAG TPA: elongation factor G [Lutibacter sp.]|nr:elongation factor G [Lutibacter sp.]